MSALARSGWVAALLWLVWLALASAVVAILWLRAAPRLFGDAQILAIMLVFVTTGAVLATARPRNAIGWLLVAVALLDAFFRVGANIALELPGLISASSPIAVAVALSSPLSQLIFGLLILMLLTFPDGRFLSPRWKLAAIGLIGVVAASVLVTVLAAGPIHPDLPGVAKPFGIEALAPIVPIARLAFIPAFVGLLLGVASLFRRYRGGGHVLRQQIKWVAASASLLALFFLKVMIVLVADKTAFPGAAAATRGYFDLLFLVAILGLPLAIAFAVLRYRLYDIDILINRALVYGAVSALLVATYFGFVLLLQTLLRPFTTGSELAVAGSTLAVVALFQPLRRRVQDAVDRRFYRSRYDAARTLDVFSARLRDQVELDAVRADLVGVVHDTIRPAHVSVWLRGR